MTTASFLLDTHPDIASEWHPVRNAEMDLATVATFSNKKVWWTHTDGRGDVHEWQQIVRNRTIEGTGCPTCRKVSATLPDFQPARAGHSLGERFPAVAALWHPTRNGRLAPSEVTPRSIRGVWWQCTENHEWIRRISTQVQASKNERACAECCRSAVPANRVPLAIANPELAAQWHPSRNEDLVPGDIGVASTQKVWWIGPCGHQWKSAVVHRHGYGTGCPKCATNNASKRVTQWLAGNAPTLAEKAPRIAAEWHPTKNGDLTPNDVTFGSAKRVWWRCSVGHEWNNTVNSRTGRNRGCWCCRNPHRIPVPETVRPEESIAAQDPRVAAEWHPTRNGLARPENVAARSTQQVWWQCAEGHTWQSQPTSRTSTVTQCRACANKAERNSRDDVRKAA